MSAVILLNVIPAMIMLLAGLTMYIWPPTKPNAWYGYRSSRSMKNLKVWELAQRLSRNLFMLGGGLMLLMGLLMTYLPVQLEHAQLALYIALVVVLILKMLYVENQLKKLLSQ